MNEFTSRHTTKEPVKSQKSRLAIVDMIKGVCIIFILVIHFGWGKRTQLVCLFPYSIDLAVPVFMVLSGYVYSNSYISKGITQFEDAYKASIIIKRIIRYMIPFLMIYVVELCFYIAGDGLSLKDVIYGFFTGGYGPGSYYVPQMIQITFVLPIILFSMYRNPRMGLAFWLFFNLFYELIKSVVELDQKIYRLTVFRYTFLLAFGCYIYLKKTAINIVYSRISIAVGVIYIFITKYCGYKTRIINDDWKGTSFMVAFLVGPLIMICLRYGSRISVKLLEKIGQASYHIFLVQVVFYNFLQEDIEELKETLIVHIIPRMLTCFFCVSVCILAGVLFYYIDKKIIESLEGFLKNNKKLYH